MASNQAGVFSHVRHFKTTFMNAFMPDTYVQIDMKRIEGNAAICNLYTGGRCVKIAMAKDDYESLVRDGFFIRDGKQADSAGVLNTTTVFIPEK